MENEEEVNNSEKLNLIASLLLDIKESLSDKISIKDKVAYVVKRGIKRDEDIASILGITKSYASKEKAIFKKENKENQNGREETI